VTAAVCDDARASEARQLQPCAPADGDGDGDEEGATAAKDAAAAAPPAAAGDGAPAAAAAAARERIARRVRRSILAYDLIRRRRG